MRAMRTALTIVAGSGIWLAAARPATAQLQSFDPYDPYGMAYRSFAYPGAGNNPSLPNAARYGALGPYSRPLGAGIAGANQLDQFYDEGTGPYSRGDVAGFSRGGSRYSRYDSAYRLYDRDFNRTFTPNEKADSQFLLDQQKRDDLYFRAMREHDPQKRADLMRQMNQESQRSTRDAGAARRRGTASGGSVARRGGGAPEIFPGRTPRSGASTPAPPPIPATPRGILSAPAAGRSAVAAPAASEPPRTRERTPTEVLDRARRMDPRPSAATSRPVPPGPAGADRGRSNTNTPGGADRGRPTSPAPR